MYCMKCGVELAEGEKVCPLCGLKAYHPGIGSNDGSKLYPVSRVPSYESLNHKGLMFILTVAFIVPIVITLLSDLAVTGTFSWSGYVIGGVVLFYICSVLPFWFKNPNPVIFIPVFFAAVVLYLLYIDIATGDEWFLSFAFPAVGALGLLVTAATTVIKYVRRGYWYIAASCILALGGYTVLVEFLLYITFGIKTQFPWSFYPFAGCFIIGIAVMVIAISKPLRRRVQRKFFI